MSTIETVKQNELFRRFTSEPLEFREENSRKLRFPASSELPVERFYGNEVLSHVRGAVRLQRASGGAMPLLFNHDVNDPIGMITSAELKGGRMWVDAELFDTARAAEIQKMMAGGLRNVSLAYRVNELVEDKKSGTFTATDWEPYEVSIVTVPADPSVGIGRGAESVYEVRMVRTETTARTATTKGAAMADKEIVAVESAEVKQVNPIEMEQRRKQAIENLCKTNKLDDNYRDMWIGQGASLEQVADDMLKIMEERGKTNPTSVAKIGLTEKETREFSLGKAINACASRDWKGAEFELEAIKAVAQRMGKTPDPHKFYVPFEVLMRKMPVRGDKRDLTVASSGGGGYLVATENMGFIDMLYNRSVAFNMGVRRLSGLTSSITIPRMSASGTAYWLASESTAATESQQTFQQVSMTPKTAAAYTEISRQLLLQSSPGAEGIVTDDLAQIVATAADLAVLNGAGSNGEPDGIIGFSGTGSVAAGSLNYAAVLEFQTDVASSKVRPQSGGYVTTAAVAAIAKQRQRFSSTDTPLWSGNIWDGQIEGFRAMSSEQVPSATMIFGDWSEIVVGEWGVLEVEVNPYANFQAGIIGVRCMYTMDVGIRRPYAFSIMQTIS